jgi:hypothetical protein
MESASFRPAAICQPTPHGRGSTNYKWVTRSDCVSSVSYNSAYNLLGVGHTTMWLCNENEEGIKAEMYKKMKRNKWKC